MMLLLKKVKQSFKEGIKQSDKDKTNKDD